MDDAAQRVDLRGLKLLERCRALRRDDAARALSHRLGEVDAARTAERDAQADLVGHRKAWLAREDAIMAASIGSAITGRHFRKGLDELDEMADGMVLRQGSLSAASAAISVAEASAQAARTHLAAQQRRLQQSGAIGERVLALRAAAAESAAEQELDEDIAMRFGRLRCSR